MKSRSDFYTNGRNIQSACKVCSKNASIEWRKKHPNESKRLDFKKKLRERYDLDFGQYEELLKAQNGLCAACEKPNQKLQVDHCHRTGKVRSLLCHGCNSALGKVNDDIEVLLKLVSYLKRFSS